MEIIKAMLQMILMIPLLCCCAAMVAVAAVEEGVEKGCKTVELAIDSRVPLPENVEVVVLGDPDFFNFSPNGQKVFFKRGDTRMLLDLVSKREMIFPPGTSAMLWLNDDLILTSISREPQFQFCIIDADDLSRTDLQMLNMHECNVDELRELLKGNEMVAQVPSWGVVALAPDFEASRMGYYISCRRCKEEDFKELLKDINYVTLKSSMYYWRDGEKIFSPNGQFYALRSGRGTPDKRLGIYYSKSGELLTEVHRRDYPIPLGLGLRMWGWAYDNSGVFFQITRYPELYYIPGPLYKLPAQPTETEARVWPFIAWLTVLLVGTGLVGAFAVRRKRRLSPNADD